MTGPRRVEAPDWLTARPIAHRGLHGQGIVENSSASARAAIGAGYAIECDIQASRDGVAMVFHDDRLERLTPAAGQLDGLDAETLTKIAYKDSAETIVTLRSFLDAVAGRVPVVVEIKSRFDGDMRLAERALEAVAAYPGPVALKSFDPQLLVHLRAKGARCPLGLVAEASYAARDWPELSEARREALADWRDYPAAAPDFLSWNAADLPHAVPMLCRRGIGMPVMTWTVRSELERSRVLPWADQILFEGFAP